MFILVFHSSNLLNLQKFSSLKFLNSSTKIKILLKKLITIFDSSNFEKTWPSVTICQILTIFWSFLTVYSTSQNFYNYYKLFKILEIYCLPLIKKIMKIHMSVRYLRILILLLLWFVENIYLITFIEFECSNILWALGSFKWANKFLPNKLFSLSSELDSSYTSYTISILFLINLRTIIPSS